VRSIHYIKEEREVSETNADQDWLKLGFDPDSPVYQADVTFTVDELKRSLFDTTIDVPVTIPFSIDTDDDDPIVDISVVVTSLKQVWVTPTNTFGLPVRKPFRHPSWVIEGWVQGSIVTPHRSATRIRAHLETGGSPELSDYCYLQVIQNTPTPGQAIVLN
jgi:hypothetical protein